MKTQLIGRILFWSVIFGIYSLNVIGQVQANLQVNTMVRPPFGTNLYSYADQTRVVITSTVATRGTLFIRIKGNNGIELRTAPDFLYPSLSIEANQMNQFSGIDLSPYFDYQRMIMKGITMNNLMENGLPEGNYQICVRVRDMSGNFISSDEPSGCSNFFTIRYGNPPMTINPQCGARLSQSVIQNVVFSWTPATNAAPWTQYTFKIVELLDSTQNPNAAMLSATEPAFFETTVTGAFSFLYGPAQPMLEKGKIYAWQVIAEDKESGAKFSNNGKSPVCWFKWDPIQMPGLVQFEAPTEKVEQGKVKVSDLSNVDPVPISMVKGKLNYKFKGTGGSGTSQLVQGAQYQVSMTGDGLVYNQDNVSPSGSKPLANVMVSLILVYVVKGTAGNATLNGEPISMNNMAIGSAGFKTDFPDHEKVLATTTTGSDGSFSFTFMNNEPKLGLIDDNINWASNSGEFFDKIQGKIYKVIRLRVENKYYCSPDINIKLDPWKSLELGTAVSYVKSYNLNVYTKWTTAKFWDVFTGQGTPLDEVKTVIIRKNTISNIPKDEAGAPTGNLISVVYPRQLKAESSNLKGLVAFKNLVQHDPDNNQDRYYIKCVPDKNHKKFIFKQKEKSYYPLYLKDKLNFPFNAVRSETPASTPSGYIAVPQAYGEDVVWNSQLNVKTYEMEMELYPDDPRIAGKVETVQVGTKPMSNVTLMLVSAYKENINFGGVIRTAKTDANGYYEFNKLDVELGAYNSQGVTSVIGPDRTLYCSHSGFKSENRPIGVMKWGQQAIIPFFLEPDGLLAGYVEDENGKAVAADVQVDDLAFGETKMMFEVSQSSNQGGGNYQFLMPSEMKQVFSIKAPSGQDRTLTIIPKDPGYASQTYKVNVPKAGAANQETKTYVVYRMMKRIRFMVSEKPAAGVYSISSLKPVPNAEVFLDLAGKTILKTTDSKGYVEFEFENNQNSFTFKIKPPGFVDLENGVYTINNVKDSKTMVDYAPAYLKKATRIAGKVTFGDNTGISGATVYIEKGNGDRLETRTNRDGSYLLTQVPMQPANVTVWASKPNSVPNINSQSKQITLKSSNQLDFVLEVDNDILIESIFGFAVDIKEKEKQSDGTYMINGALINLPANPNFKMAEQDKSIPFVKLKIKKGSNLHSSGIPIGVPVTNSFDTDLKDLYLIANNAFGVVQTPSTGSLLKVSSENNLGQIKGKIGVMKASFQYSESYVAFQDNFPFYLTEQPGSSQTDIIGLTTKDFPAKKWGLTGNNNSDVQFTFQDFSAKADKSKSFMEGDKITLSTIITTNEIKSMMPSKLSVAIGELSLRPTKIDPISGSNPITFKLEKWDVQSQGWSIQQNKKGIYMPQGTIKTGIIDVPVKNMVITADNFDVGEFEMQNLSLSGVVPIKVLTQNRSFGFNPSTGKDQKGHWELRIIGLEGSPGVSVAGLPGMEANTELKFQTLSLLSNGEQIINLGNQQQELVFHKIFKVKPISISGGDKYFDIICNIDLNVPRIEPASGVVRFTKPANQINFEIFPFNMSFDGPGGVKFTSAITQGDQKLTASEFTAAGSLTDKEGINLKAKLHRTPTAAWIDVDPKNQKMPLGSGLTSLNNIEGKMEVSSASKDWTKLKFSGEMSGFKGMESNARKTFTVHGSITAENEGLGVKNISGSFAGMNLTYDLQNARLIGDMDIDRQIGAMRMKGAANIMVDASGWYFLSGGQLTAPGFGNMAAGMIIGDCKVLPPSVTQTLMQFAYNKNVPASLKTGVSGFFFTGQKDLPIINIPNFSIDLGILSASLGLSAGLDGRVWMGFDGGGNEYGIGAMAFAHAWFSASSITCTKLSAEARAELGATGIYQTNSGAFTVAGCGSFTIGGSASQCFPTPCWDGICCTSCIGGSISKGIKVDMMFNSQGKTSLDFSFGNCSGQTSMTSNW